VILESKAETYGQLSKTTLPSA